jgi:hypothetical protein
MRRGATVYRETNHPGKSNGRNMALSRPMLIVSLGILASVSPGHAAQKNQGDLPWSNRVQTVLDVTRRLEFPRGKRLPLYLWPASNPGLLNAADAERLVRELDQRGVGLVSSWSPKRRDASLAEALAVARAQTRLGVPVNVNASACLSAFFNGDERTAHVDRQGRAFWDESFNSGRQRHPMGCPFTLGPRKDPIREQVDGFARAYQEAGLKVDFVFVDWEIDGPIEYNRAFEAARRCVRCREHFQDPENFLEFQKVLRGIRSELQRYTLADPIRERFPGALVGNYAVYPHDGYREWYDYFEYFVEGQPHIDDQRARYRLWANEFPGTGYTCAMPVLYTWYPTYGWYDFDNHDYRWFYNLLLIASNAGKSTPAGVPIISFVHWHTTSPPEKPDPAVKQFSAEAYQELLWHMLLRGTDTFFLWCLPSEDAEECRLVHGVYAAAQQYGDFLEQGTPISFDVPKRPGTVVSGLRLGNRVLVRRTDFGGSTEPVEIVVGTKKIAIRPLPGKCQLLDLGT